MFWYERYGWGSNPFEQKPMPDAISGFDDIRSRLLEFIKSGECCMLFGEAGMGKTTLLKWIESYDTEDFVPIYINTFGMSGDQIVKLNIDKLVKDRMNFFGKLMGKEKKIVLLIDDAETMPQIIGDAVKRNFEEHSIKAVVIASSTADNSSSLSEKIGSRKIKMRHMKADEAMGMIVNRVGYKNPFDHEGLEIIFKSANFIPKGILDMCESVAKSCIEKSITKSFVESYISKEKAEVYSRGFIEKLSPLQARIVEALLVEDLRPKEMAQKLKKPAKTVTSQLAYLSLKAGLKTMARKGIDRPVVEKVPGRHAVYTLADWVREILTKE